jgi:hypothetical protein
MDECRVCELELPGRQPWRRLGLCASCYATVPAALRYEEQEARPCRIRDAARYGETVIRLLLWCHEQGASEINRRREIEHG